MLTTLLNKVRIWFSKEALPDKCLQCGMAPGHQFMVPTNEPIMHPHECSWCKSVLYVPGPMFQCKMCAEIGIKEPAA